LIGTERHPGKRIAGDVVDPNVAFGLYGDLLSVRKKFGEL
jgi:hypothetical protein